MTGLCGARTQRTKLATEECFLSTACMLLSYRSVASLISLSCKTNCHRVKHKPQVMHTHACPNSKQTLSVQTSQVASCPNHSTNSAQLTRQPPNSCAVNLQGRVIGHRQHRSEEHCCLTRIFRDGYHDHAADEPHGRPSHASSTLSTLRTRSDSDEKTALRAALEMPRGT